MENMLISIVMTALIALGIELIKPEITKLRGIMRKKPFESFVVVGLCVVIAISLYGTFFKELFSGGGGLSQPNTHDSRTVTYQPRDLSAIVESI